MIVEMRSTRESFKQRRYGAPLRHGFSLIEMIGTCLLLGILFSITVPMLLVVARERRATEQRQCALQHATNLLERTTSQSWTDLEPGEVSLEPADTDLQTILPGLERSIIVKQVEGELVSRQIVASIRWQNRAGQIVAPLQLSAWVYPPREVP